jgi:hypothetical protein
MGLLASGLGLRRRGERGRSGSGGNAQGNDERDESFHFSFLLARMRAGMIARTRLISRRGNPPDACVKSLCAISWEVLGGKPRKSVAGLGVARQFSLSTPCAKFQG